MSSAYQDKVIAIGALGGSGTRAVAKLLLDLGIFMGDPLNFANDNTFFTACFVNPSWRQSASKQDIKRRLQVFENYMRNGQIAESDLNAIERLPYALTHQYPPELFPYLRSVETSSRDLKLWGWKEPNTHLYLEELHNYFPGLRYIHVLRHGLDMAFARNKKQLFNWGHLFGISAEPSDSPEQLASKQLDYWIASTRSVLKKGKSLLGDRFFVLPYEESCESPEKVVPQLLQFLELKVDGEEKLYDIFQLSEGSGRYREQDLSIFSADQLEAVKELGFSIS